MKQSVLICAYLVLLTTLAASGQKLRAEFAMARFESPTDGPYLETYIRFKGNSLRLVDGEAGPFSEVVISYSISKGVWVPFKDTYKITGPVATDTLNPLDFIDQRRIPLKPGAYELSIMLRDIHDPSGFEAKVNQAIIIEKKKPMNLDSMSTSGTQSVYRSDFFLSDIQLVDSYTPTENHNILSKLGKDLIPYTSNYFPQGKKEIIFYAEVYHHMKEMESDKDAFLVNTFIENADNGSPAEGLRTFSKKKFAEVVPILQSFPLEQLPTGNFNLVVEVRDRENRLLDRRFLFFQHTGSKSPDPVDESTGEDYVENATSEKNELYQTFVAKYHDLDDLKEYLRCLHPISTQEEISQVNRRMNFSDRNMMWRFMYYFWKKRNPENPEAAWEKYWAEVQKVNANYTTNLRKGYDTDRGRVYLQYGPPNTISPNYFEPNTYPYEIWHYYTLRDHISADQSNRKFIFANTEEGTQEFKLIHSDAKNEITNIRWNYDLHKRSTSTIDLDQEDAGEHYGGRSKDFFENPY